METNNKDDKQIKITYGWAGDQVEVKIDNYPLKHPYDFINYYNVGKDPRSNKWDPEDKWKSTPGTRAYIYLCEYRAGDGGYIRIGKWRHYFKKGDGWASQILKKYREILQADQLLCVTNYKEGPDRDWAKKELDRHKVGDTWTVHMAAPGIGKMEYRVVLNDGVQLKGVLEKDTSRILEPEECI